MWGKSGRARDGGREGKRVSCREKLAGRERGCRGVESANEEVCASHIECELCCLADSLSAATYFRLKQRSDGPDRTVTPCAFSFLLEAYGGTEALLQ